MVREHLEIMLTLMVTLAKRSWNIILLGEKGLHIMHKEKMAVSVSV